jgi:ribosome-associated protein
LTEELDRMEKLRLVTEAVVDKKAEDVVVLDVRAVSSFADTFVIATGRSDRQVQSIVDGVQEAARRHGWRSLGVEGYSEGRWVLVDLVDVIVHVFQADARENYDLERLYADAPQVPLTSEAARENAR